MKKFCFFIFLIFCSFALVSCSSKKNFSANISEKDEMLFSCEDDNFFVTLCTGKRENPYVVDGKSEKLIDFAVLSVFKKSLNVENNKVEFDIKTENIQKKGTFEVNPFDGSFVVDLLDVGENPKNITVTIKADGKTYDYTLSPALNEGSLSADEVLTIATKQLTPVKNQLTKENKISFELYIRLMQNPGQVPLWYVSAINEENELFAMIIDPNTKEVIAKNFK